MPSQFLPRKSFAHRVACKALYRALLKPCPHIPLPPDLPSRGPINPIKHLVRKRFRQYVHTTSEKMVVKALSVGYAVENLLRDAASGNEKALEQTHTILKSLNEQYLYAKAHTPPPKPNPIARPPRPIPFPGAPKTIDIRPLPQHLLGGKGRRLIPKLVTMGSGQSDGIDFIRFKKPMSAYLGRVLRQKSKAKERRWEGVERVEAQIELGAQEAAWEVLVLQAMKSEWRKVNLSKRDPEFIEEVEDDEEREIIPGENGRLWEFHDWGNRYMWTVESSRAVEEIRRSISRENRARARFGARWMEIILKEKQLREEEERERRHRVRVEKNVRKWGFDNGEGEVGEIEERKKAEEREVMQKGQGELDKMVSFRPSGQPNIRRVTGAVKTEGGTNSSR